MTASKHDFIGEASELVDAFERGHLSRRELLVRSLAAGISLATMNTLLGGWESASQVLADAAKATPSGPLTIAYQPGIGYAQIVIMKQKKWLEHALPHMQIAYNELASGSAIRDGMLAGQIQIGSGGVGPFVVGWSAGVDWKLLSALNQMDLWLMVKDKRIKSLKDFKSSDKIAMPAPDSIQAVILRKAAQKELNDAHALDANIISMAHPDGLQALLSGQIAGHLTSPPFQFTELQKGAHRILNSYSLFGKSTFNSVFVRNSYHNDNKMVMMVLFNQIERATFLIHHDPHQAAQVLSDDAGGKASAKDFYHWIKHPGVDYTVTPRSFMNYAKFMKQIGLINTAPRSWRDLVFDNLKKMHGS